MKAIIGSAIGVLAIGLVLVGAGLRGAASGAQSSLIPAAGIAPAMSQPRTGDGALTDASARAASGPVMVNCGPGQRALVRQVLLDGETVSQVACVGDRPASSAIGGMAVAEPVAYRAPRPVRVAQRRVVYQEPAPERVAQQGSSWKKRLLVIGGSTAAGAGIGGLVGGKKGALIGAALGGGASTIYEAVKK